MSLSRPWDYVILHCGKDVENRKWATTYRGRICIHRAKSFDVDGHRWLMDNRRALGLSDADMGEIAFLQSEFIRPGGLVGEVDITGCVTRSDSPWFFGPYAFTLARPVAYDMVIPCRGHQKLWTVPTVNGMLGGRHFG